MSYWSKRMKKAQENWSNKNIDAINAQMKKYYGTAMNQAINDYTALYEKIEAKRAAGEEVSVANLYALDKYWETQAQMKEELQKLGDKQETLLAEKFEKEYADIHKAVSITGDKSFNLINKTNAEQVAREIWAGDGKNYSQRLWQNVNKLQQMLDDELVSCVSAGRKTTALKQGLMEKFNVSYRQADRLARTEIAHIEVEASRRRWQDEGVQQVEIYVDEDERTCPQCAELEGKKYKITEKMPVPVHPSCRCTILPVIPEGATIEEIEYTERANGRRDYYIDENALTKEQKDAIMPLVNSGAKDIYIKHCPKCDTIFYSSDGHCPKCGTFTPYSTDINIRGNKVSSLSYDKNTGKFSYFEDTQSYMKRMKEEEELKEALRIEAKKIEEANRIRVIEEAKEKASALTKRGLTEDKPYISSKLVAEKKSALAGNKELTYYGHTCKYCGRYFETQKPIAHKCPICKNTIEHEGNKKHISVCIKCGKGFIAAPNSVGVCPNCQKEMLATNEATKLLKKGYTEKGTIKVMTGQTQYMEYIRPEYDTDKINDTLFGGTQSLLDLYAKQNPDVDKYSYDNYSWKEKINNKFFVCIDCGKVVQKSDNRNNTQKRCPECQAKWRKKYKAQKEKERRAKNKNK